MIVQCALLKCYTILGYSVETVNIPIPPDQHHCSDEAKWRIGGHLCSTMWVIRWKCNGWELNSDGVKNLRFKDLRLEDKDLGVKDKDNDLKFEDKDKDL